MSEEVRYKEIIQVGENVITEGLPASMLLHKVLCNRLTAIAMHKCVRCRHHRGLENPYLVKCVRKPNEDPPDEIMDDTHDIDYDNEELTEEQ